MTVSVVMAALVSILSSTGIGSDIMKPIAATIIGGMVTSTIHVLIITPVSFYLMKTRALRGGALRDPSVIRSAYRSHHLGQMSDMSDPVPFPAARVGRI